MKKIILAIAGFLTITFFVAPWKAYAGGANVAIGFNIRVGTPHVVVRHPAWIGPKVHYWPRPVAIAPYVYYRIPSVIVIEKGPACLPPPPPNHVQESYWYYCPDSQAYYPYVKTCPGGWLKVLPQTVPPDADPKP